MAVLATVQKWLDAAIPPLLRRTWSEFSEDRIPAVAGGVTFFVLLALFPAVASIVSLYGLFADRASISHVLDALIPYLPGGAITVLNTELHRLLLEKPAKLNVAFYGGLVVALWSASGGVKALIDGLNVAFETKESRSFLKLTGNALLFTALAIILSVGAVYLTVVIPRFAFTRVLGPALVVLRWPVAFGVIAVMMGLIYRIGPDRRSAAAGWITWGSAAGALLWIGSTLLFSWFVQNFGSYDRVYGNLGAAVGFLTWIWISLMILLAGAELDSEMEKVRRTKTKLG